ncbi:FG-GAP-like repeat-containing protein [Muriicola sp. E247]|uniref:FG-GAP-like repeat-containing protein n=1 Tax=Muriicola sp. E247 TaxID=3242730 RepID=UPI003525D5F7
MTPFFKKFAFLVPGFFMAIVSCDTNKQERQLALYQSHCARCHIAPEMDDLPKGIWEEAILPDMAARMGIREDGYDPLKGLAYEEMEAVIKTGIYPLTPTLSMEDWQLLKAYILEHAPDSLTPVISQHKDRELSKFTPELISFEGPRRRSYAFLEFQQESGKLLMGDMGGELMSYGFEDGLMSIGNFESLVVAHEKTVENTFITTIGNIHPSALSKGKAYRIGASDTLILEQALHRPVHTLVEDLDKDGQEEMVISEFGDLTGELSLFIQNDAGYYDKKTLLNQPGTIRVVSEDMDGDGLMDLIALTSQGDETITILFQKKDLSFEAQKVLRFNPVYGSSWFELMDYEGDGDLDLVTVHGDNADKSYVHKPYHGMRLHLNDGRNNFTEVFFYPMNGATRVVASDFDQDGDMDFGLLSTFPDYENAAKRTFVFLDNTDSEAFQFDSYTVEDSLKAKWFLMDKGDVDADGDTDIILSSFSLPFIPAPQQLADLWKNEAIDLMILENKLK